MSEESHLSVHVAFLARNRALVEEFLRAHENHQGPIDLEAAFKEYGLGVTDRPHKIDAPADADPFDSQWDFFEDWHYDHYHRRQDAGLASQYQKLTPEQREHPQLPLLDLSGYEASVHGEDARFMRYYALKDVFMPYADMRQCKLADRTRDRGRFLFNRANLTGSDMREIELTGIRMEAAIMRNVNLTEAVIKDCDLSQANLQHASLRGASISDTDLTGANLSGADLRGASLMQGSASLAGVDLTGANLTGLSGKITSLAGANLEKATLVGLNLSGLNLSGLNLSGANLSGANLKDANLKGANLEGANLSGTILNRANLHGANLRLTKASDETTLHDAWIEGANFTGSQITPPHVINNETLGSDPGPR